MDNVFFFFYFFSFLFFFLPKGYVNIEHWWRVYHSRMEDIGKL